jgi:hypothetical protein
MSGDHASAIAAHKAILANLAIIYPSSISEAPSNKYVGFLTWALCNNDAALLMKTLNSEEIKPWDILFVEDGLGEDSPDQQSMLEFAVRKKSWDCFAGLVRHYQDYGQSAAIYETTEPAMAEYEVATDHERIQFLEVMLRAANRGYANHLTRSIGINAIFLPSYPVRWPKAARFIVKDFTSIKFSNKKLPPTVNKRLDLRQMSLAAISDGDGAELSNTLDFLYANAMARAAKREPQDILTTNEIETFILVALACDHPQCVDVILSKVVKNQKAQTLAKLAAKKVKEEEFIHLAHEGIEKLLNRILHIAKVIDQRCSEKKYLPPASVEAVIKKALFDALSEMPITYLNEVKAVSDKNLSVMQSCVNLACGHAESHIKKQELAAAIPENDEPVSAPRKRVRL